MPVHGNKQDQYLLNCLSPEKDVEGLSHLDLYNMYHNIRFLDQNQKKKSILPCTPLGIVKVLEYLQIYHPLLHHGNRLYGKTVLVVNRSEVVGRPLAALLANDGATVYSLDLSGMQLFTRGAGIKLRCHHVTDISNPLSEIAPKCDVIITGVPNPAYKFPTNLIRDGAVCICFSSYKNFQDDVQERASIYVPSIGKVTIAMLCRNQLRLIENRTVSS
ncbi:Methylenetetrahydrofolate dehydrogenase [NAD(+)] [Neolecta irregularis DAH-3]|uniref:Methylenetetrahydrofolate dehydrogenase [NAD(+)] n=1 Tax=Neolecta irregularis (strain DAH-3) TaxID=1198029 RepID=A0A1U7LV38_NEOID|nr:Methylenetetrahydrofolate dehydrogenase [NAD(+)] [Neolecta irregularis DAH-3]|eukprot:OLL26489.1 Methylenetetrahydrofolate dehydrogenase [NAD(+)] [Neolecta irregularis DAH-3]